MKAAYQEVPRLSATNAERARLVTPNPAEPPTTAGTPLCINGLNEIFFSGRSRFSRSDRFQHPAKNAATKSKKSCEFVAPELLKSALPAKKLVRKSKKS